MSNLTEKTVVAENVNASSSTKPISLTNAAGEVTERAVIVIHAALGGTVEEIKAISRPQGFWKGIANDLGYGYSCNEGIWKLTFPEKETPAQTAENIGVSVRMPKGGKRFVTAAEAYEILTKAKEKKRYTALTTAEQTALSLNTGGTTEEAATHQEGEQEATTDEAPTSKKGKGKRK